MRMVKAFSLACSGLWANRFRVFLSMMGVVIGIFAVIVLTSIAVGVKETVIKQMGNLGVEQLMVIPGRVLTSESGQHNFLNGISSVSSTLTSEDIAEIEKVASVKSVTPILETIGKISSDRNGEVLSAEGMLIGTSEHYQQVLHLQMEQGRFFSKDESAAAGKTVVLGSSIHQALLNQQSSDSANGHSQGTTKESSHWWEKLYNWLIGSVVVSADGEKGQPESNYTAVAGNDTLVGKEVLIQGQPFKVIGVLQSNATIGSTTNNSIIIPIQTALQLTTMKNLTTIYVEAQSLASLEEAEREVYSAIKKNHRESDFSIVKQTEMLEAFAKVNQILKVMLIGITAIAMLISGVGIMNVMLMSVRERTREIGIRKALGASTLEILYQFFFETILLCAIGGAIGIGLGYAFVEWWNGTIIVFSLVLPLWAVKMAIASSIGIGCFCGIFPAVKAANQQPSQALRYE